TAVERGIDVVHVGGLRDPQRLDRDHAVREDREVLLEVATVDLDDPGAGAQTHARDRFLAAAGALHERPAHARSSTMARLLLAGIPGSRPCARSANGVGCCAAWGWAGPAYTRSLPIMLRPRRPFGNMPFTARRTTRSGSRAKRCSSDSSRRP